jgi:alkanesulfonate monooxygenase SsuD/methylene tetrahydromethanopterin reductase-like flavin-dependent oxidoreductase (luciferase family)
MTPTVRCPTSNRPTTRPLPGAESGTATRRPSPPPGANARRPKTCRSARIIAVTSRQQFVGTPAQVADEIDLHVQSDACDGFILVPHLTPHGLDDFVDGVVPLLQERRSFRTEYTGHTLREHLGL